MPRTCTICTHPEREAIDRALVLDKLSFRDIARQWRVSKDAVSRHQDHIPKALVKAEEAAEVAQATTLLGDLQTGRDRADFLYSVAEDILGRAREANDLKTALKAIAGAVDVMREAREYLKLKGEVTGELANKQDDPARAAVLLLPVMVPPGQMPDVQASQALQAPQTPGPSPSGPGDAASRFRLRASREDLRALTPEGEILDAEFEELLRGRGHEVEGPDPSPRPEAAPGAPSPGPDARP